MTARIDVEQMIERARLGDRRALAKLISLVEDRRVGDTRVLASLYPTSGRARLTGLTGAPGSGKSTLTDRLIDKFRAADSQVGVLAVDPSSPFSGGAILGDRVRMQRHVDDGGVYVRSMASRGHLGGISEATPRAVVVLGGVGFDEVMVETVGVGQAEVDIAATADTTIVVLNPGWGDSVQAAKAGLLEIGDVFAVNKADRPGVNDTVRDLKQMLELGAHDGWWPPVVTSIATAGEGIDELFAAIVDHREYLDRSGRLVEERRRHALTLLDEAVEIELRAELHSRGEASEWNRLRELVAAHDLDPWSAAKTLVGAAEAPQ